MPYLISQQKKRKNLIKEYEEVPITKRNFLSVSEQAGAVLKGDRQLPPDHLCEFDYWYDVKLLVDEVSREVSEEEIQKEQQEIESRAKIQADRLDKIKAALHSAAGTGANNPKRA